MESSSSTSPTKLIPLITSSPTPPTNDDSQVDENITSVVDSFCLDDCVVISHPFEETSPKEDETKLDEKSKWSLYQLVPSCLWTTIDAMDNRIGLAVDSLIDYTPQQVKDTLASSIMLALRYG